MRRDDDNSTFSRFKEITKAGYFFEDNSYLQHDPVDFDSFIFHTKEQREEQ
jgi:hypothetical protein